jgi:uncharacterized membrane protein
MRIGRGNIVEVRWRMIGKSIRNGVAVVALSASNLLPHSPFSVVLRYLAMGVILIDLVLTAREGYRRRLPYWTADSWRRYLLVCAVPVGALAMLAGMLAALEYRHPWIGPARSTTRAIWAAGSGVCIVIGAGGLALAVQWLAHGDPTRQFPWPRWRVGSSSGPGSLA